MNTHNSFSSSQGASVGAPTAGQYQQQPPAQPSTNIPGLNVPPAAPWFYVPNRARTNPAATPDAQWHQQQIDSQNTHNDNVRFFQENPRAYFVSLMAELRAIGPVDASANEIVFFYIKLNSLVNEYCHLQQLFQEQGRLSRAAILCRFLSGVRPFYHQFASDLMRGMIQRARQNKLRQQLGQDLRPYPSPEQLLQRLRQGMAQLRQPRLVEMRLSTMFDRIVPTNRRAVFNALDPGVRQHYLPARPLLLAAMQQRQLAPMLPPQSEEQSDGTLGSEGLQRSSGKRRLVEDDATEQPPFKFSKYNMNRAQPRRDLQQALPGAAGAQYGQQTIQAPSMALDPFATAPRDPAVEESIAAIFRAIPQPSRQPAALPPDPYPLLPEAPGMPPSFGVPPGFGMGEMRRDSAASAGSGLARPSSTRAMPITIDDDGQDGADSQPSDR